MGPATCGPRPAARSNKALDVASADRPELASRGLRERGLMRHRPLADTAVESGVVPEESDEPAVIDEQDLLLGPDWLCPRLNSRAGINGQTFSMPANRSLRQVS
jgi:hypothetical protein